MPRLVRTLAWASIGFAVVALIAAATDTAGLTSSGTVGAALRLSLPIGLAGLGGLWSERAGVINIGLEGMLILGTWFGAYGGVELGPWWGVLFGVLGGALGGLLHAIATVRFGVDHIISGVAINLLGAGVARYLNIVVFGDRTGATQSPRVSGHLGSVSVPFLAGGDLFGWHTPDLFGWFERRSWVIVSDLAGVLGGLTRGVSLVVVLGVALFPLTWWVLWRTPFGLRVRSVGEDPAAAESLGVDVYRMKTIAVTISGGLSGLGGAILVLLFAGIYREGQTGGRGFIGLAAMIFGNWNPAGLLLGSGLFGYTDALQLRDEHAIHTLLLLVAVLVGVMGARAVVRGRVGPALLWLGAGTASFLWWDVTDQFPRQLVGTTPHIVTLLVLVFASQRLRMPAADGLVYRRGEAR
jgi:simple sugar transport system permease protein